MCVYCCLYLHIIVTIYTSCLCVNTYSHNPNDTCFNSKIPKMKGPFRFHVRTYLGDCNVLTTPYTLED